MYTYRIFSVHSPADGDLGSFHILAIVKIAALNIEVQLCVCAQLLHSCPTLRDPVGCSPPGSSVPGILQARILEWVACLALLQGVPAIEPASSTLASRFLTISANLRSPGVHKSFKLELTQWHPTPVLLPGKSHGWRGLVGCCLWGHTELDTTEVT